MSATATNIDPNVSFYNTDPADQRINANALFFYPDPSGSPSMIVVAIGHLVNLSQTGPVPFDNGSDIRTMPFRVDTGRLGKPLNDLNHEDLAHFKATYKLSNDSSFSILVRQQLEFDMEAQFERDLEVYAATYHERRQSDIAEALEEAIADAARIKCPRPDPIPILFGIKVLPAPTESAVFDSIYQQAQLETKIFATVWSLVRRPNYAEQISPLANPSGVSPPRLAVHLQSKPDASWCLGIERREPLALIGHTPEIAHFHRVAFDREAALGFGQRLSAELQRQFDISYAPEVLVDGSKPQP
jgi:hypothetical protein